MLTAELNNLKKARELHVRGSSRVYLEVAYSSASFERRKIMSTK